MSDFIKDVEQNLLNICKEFDGINNFFDAMSHFGNVYCHEYIGRKEFFEGLQKMRSAIYHEFAHAVKNLFMFSAVEGEEANKYAMEKLKEYFNDDEDVIEYSVIQFLDKFGQIPSFYRDNVEKEFRKAVKEKIKKVEG